MFLPVFFIIFLSPSVSCGILFLPNNLKLFHECITKMTLGLKYPLSFYFYICYNRLHIQALAEETK